MKSGKVIALLLIVLLGTVSAGWAEELSFKPGDNMTKALEAQVGKTVTVRLSSGEDITGKVRNVGKELLHLGELAGKEYYDALVDLEKISAMIVRVK